MGKHGSGAGAEIRIRALIAAQPDRLYGRQRGHALRPRQRQLMDVALPRLRFPAAQAAAPRDVFCRQNLQLEIGFGGGEHALARAQAEPEAGLIACEVFDNGICSLLSRLLPDGTDPATDPLPDNLRLWDGDARHLLRLLPDACLDRVFLLFPDPWPKARHAKRRFVHPANLQLLARVLKPGGVWHVASDDPTYQAWVTSVMAAQQVFSSAAPVASRPDGWPPTRYEAKALKAGRTPLYWLFHRNQTCNQGVGPACSEPPGSS